MNDKKVENLERVVNRLKRRSVKTAKAIISPYPISAVAFGEDISGPVLRYIFPADGTVIRGVVKLNGKPKAGVGINIKVFNDQGDSGISYLLERKLTVVNPEIKVMTGDCMEVSIRSDAEDFKVTEIWMAILWRPHVNSVEAMQFLIDELEKVEDAQNASED